MARKPVIRSACGIKIGARVEIAPHYDLWMRGAKRGVVRRFKRSVDGQHVIALVRMDHPRVRNLAHVYAADLKPV